MANLTQFGNDLYTGKRSIPFVAKRKIWYAIALGVMVVSIAIPLLGGGFNLGIEFRGGSQFQVTNVSDPETAPATEAVAEVVPEQVPRVTTVGDSGIRVQTEQLSDAETREVAAALAESYGLTNDDVASSFVGPSWGADITGQAVRGLLVFLGLAAIVMAIYFRTWKMSVAAMVALLHDLVFTAGVYALAGFEVTPAAVIGFLTILGFSLYDTVVVFDKIRENTAELAPDSRSTFADTVNLAVNQTLVRSINTGVVAALPVAAIFFIGSFILGADTLRDISLALLVGIIAGTYSTIFVAAPLYSHMREGEKGVRERDSRALAAREATAQ